MAAWASMGHGMRRRSGAPSNHLESAGKDMSRTHKTSDEHYDAASAAGSVRIPIGPATVATSLKGTPVPRKNTQAADPTNPGSKVNRQNIEKAGATYRIQPKSTFVQLDPAAGPTMANARIVPSIQGRVNPNFDSGIQASSL
jgi:hypothetical protein